MAGGGVDDGATAAARNLPGSLPAADVALVSRWIDLNRSVIIDLWNQAIKPAEAIARLQKLP
ncbi:MAG TPA: hypothetical protein VGF34_03800 [Stellaceae bacterium]|jgi:hypothetical protein